MIGKYETIMMKHPLQETWKPKIGDKVVWFESDGSHGSLEKGIVTTLGERDNGEFWLPTQEDWEEIFYKTRPRPQGYRYNLFHEFVEYLECFDFDRWEQIYKIEEIGFVEYLTIEWCLFVSRKAFKIKWDWKEEIWVGI